MVRRAGAAGGVGAAIIVLLPAVAWVGRRRGGDRGMERASRAVPIFELGEQGGIVGQRREAGRKRLDRAAPDWKEEGDRLAGVESYPVVGACETPVHSEGERGPVGLDYAAERRDAVLGVVRRATDPQVPPRRRAEDARDVEGQYTLAEQRYRAQMLGRARVVLELDRFGTGTAVPP